MEPQEPPNTYQESGREAVSVRKFTEYQVIVTEEVDDDILSPLGRNNPLTGSVWWGEEHKGRVFF